MMLRLWPGVFVTKLRLLQTAATTGEGGVGGATVTH